MPKESHEIDDTIEAPIVLDPDESHDREAQAETDAKQAHTIYIFHEYISGRPYYCGYSAKDRTGYISLGDTISECEKKCIEELGLRRRQPELVAEKEVLA